MNRYESSASTVTPIRPEAAPVPFLERVELVDQYLAAHAIAPADKPHLHDAAKLGYAKGLLVSLLTSDADVARLIRADFEKWRTSQCR